MASLLPGPRWFYDVFLSFRGEDTRKTFTGHLFEGLRNRGIKTFKDDKILEEGSSISEEICKAIEESQVAVIIFSRNYASSSWCLDELVKIMQCKEEYGQTVIPIFYNAAPLEIRYQRESFAIAFAKHELKYKDDVAGMHKVRSWRTALAAAANLKGCDIQDGIESEYIQQIVDQISSKLCKTSLYSLQEIVGINSHLENVKSLLKMKVDDVRIVGMWGMGGVGKTTIARAIFYALSDQFEAACFLADVKENEKRHQLHSLQNTLLSELLRKKADYVNNKEDGKLMIIRRLCLMKVLIVLDDIDHRDHLNYLAGDPGWFGNGSRVVVTTRDSHLIGKDDAVYKVIALHDREAIQLFNQYAFKNEVPGERFEKLSWEVINHAKGLPLALKVWGSFLCNRDIAEWESAIEQMKSNSNSEIVEKLKISYDGLERIQQEMFLDVACFFRGVNKDDAIRILESCNFEANIGLRVLIEKSLVFISGNVIEMHDLIQDMGKYIVKMQKDPGERSRLWFSEDFEEVMINNAGTRAVEAICIRDQPNLQFNRNALKNMNRLRILSIKNLKGCVMSCHDGSIEYLSNNLRWFVWPYYPSESLPANFEPKRLVHLELQCSSLHQLWTGIKHLMYLTRIDLHGSGRLKQTPDFTGMPKLERLVLSYCRGLEEVHHSLRYSAKLIWLDLSGCESLERFPCVNVESLEYLGLEECSSLEKFPEFLGSMKLKLKIDMRDCGIRELPSSIFEYQTHVFHLYLSGLKNILTLPNSLCRLKSLATLDVSGCNKLEGLPKEIGYLENLYQLDAKYTRISRPPSTIVRLNLLEVLSFAKEKSGGQATAHFVFPRVNEGLRSLKILDLNYCNLIDGGLPEDIGCLSTLKHLYLRGNNFDHLPQSIAHLSALQLLDLEDCEWLKELPELPPNIDTIRADHHLALRSIQYLTTKYKKLRVVVFTSECDVEHDEIAETLLQCMFSLLDAFSASDALSKRVFTLVYPGTKIPIWFHRKSTIINSAMVKLPKYWYVHDNFLGFGICYFGSSHISSVKLIPEKQSEFFCNNKCDLCVEGFGHTKRVHFLFIPFASLWDTSKANGRTPNYYRHLYFSSAGEVDKFGIHLLYKDDPELNKFGFRLMYKDDPELNRYRFRLYDDREFEAFLPETESDDKYDNELDASSNDLLDI